MTYRGQIQAIAEQIDLIHDEAGRLRDCATQEEKEAWNELRRLTMEAMQKMNKLDNSLSDGRAAMEV